MSRISYRNYPILEIIKNGKLNNLPVYKEDFEELKSKYEKPFKLFEVMSVFYKKEIIKVSSSFIKATDNARSKLLKIIEGIGIEEYSGTMIIGNFTYCYTIVLTEEIYSVNIFEFYKNGGLKNFVTNHENNEINFFSIVNNDLALSLKDNYADFLCYTILSVLTFRKYAKVEIIESKAKTKTTQFNCKYLNETDLDIEYLDSKWFTSLVSSQGFKVRGFFRLQPKKKDGEWTKELIWIDEFEKQGYNRKAGILK